MNIPVVYEDDWLIILDKPAGLLTVPTPKNESRTLTSILNEESQASGKNRFYPCHRLDRETSGLIIYAKSRPIQDQIMDLFRRHKVKKTYIAFVQKRINQPGGNIRVPIEGKQAVTRFEVLERRGDFSVVKVSPETGRTNQIRIHFKGIGHPIVGETKFAFRKDYALRHKRLCLHAFSLDFTHPVTGKCLRLQADLPEDLDRFLASRK
ncbi:MAG: RluA family pseudouridine synthase [Candidatus Omnitrophica bacterium]|jgi:RluA family pseudouridine synthase|nr:RluA family pseudouridine synthase [Candidatus Omnitrophota bacterium]MDD5079384.1 RluA family pseudouridine synthase [Candidatus Omnitrophota bacterium]